MKCFIKVGCVVKSDSKSGSFSFSNILRVNPLEGRKGRHLGQHLYFFLYMMFYGLLNYGFSIGKPFLMPSTNKISLFFLAVYSVTGEGTLKLSKRLWRYRITGLLVNFSILFRFVIFPMYRCPSFLTSLSVRYKHRTSSQNENLSLPLTFT